MLRVAVLCSGRGSNLHSLLRHIQAGHVEARVELVACDRPGAGALDVARAGRVPAVLSLPKQKGESAADYDARLLEAVWAARPGLVVLAGWMRIVGPAFLRGVGCPVVNIHPSLLPDFKGLRAVHQALAAGATQVGCTTHLVTEDLDGGPILLQARIRVRPGEAEEDVQRRVLRLEHVVLPRTVDLFARGEVRLVDGRAEVAASSTWLGRQDVDLMSGAWYGPGF